MSRIDHEFQFFASVIAEAAKKEATYHRERWEFWNAEYAKAIATVKDTASIEIVTFPISGGERADVVVKYGDPAAHKRMGEAFTKMQEHRKDAERYETDERVYATQVDKRVYELSTDDVHYFRLGHNRRPE